MLETFDKENKNSMKKVLTDITITNTNTNRGKSMDWHELGRAFCVLDGCFTAVHL